MSEQTERLAELIEIGDMDELLREIDRLCDRRAWSDLLLLRDQTLGAADRGKQLWAAAAHAEYRLALEGSPDVAASVVRTGTGRFALGPLAEVAASTHSWAELAPSLPPGPLAAITAHERVIRGEDLTQVDGIDRTVLDTPLRLQSWEPSYPLAEYKSDEAQFPSPPNPALEPSDLPGPGEPVTDDEARRALLELCSGWVTESNGRAEAVAIRGSALAAIASLGLRRARVAPVSAAEALAWMAWAAASGGAEGTRRGMASGRFAAWWAMAAVGGALEDWPLSPEDAEDIARELNWYLWDAGEPDTGWALRLAVEDPDHGLAWALAASDVAL